jgi:subfamily B ATP-binding cassette protein MsbA
MVENTKKIFDISLFQRLLAYIQPYRLVFGIALVCVVGLAVFGALRPQILQMAVDTQIAPQKFEGFVDYILIMLALLVLEVICQLLFIYYANWLGQSVVKDIRVKLFKHMLNFKMTYYDKSSVGVLITRAVTDMERIADIFGEGLFMIFSDILKMVVVAGFMMAMNMELSLIVFITLPIVLFATKIFQKYMKIAFEDVRNEVSNLNSFVQERVTGMKILQLFTREATEYKNFTIINERHKKGWLKTVWYNSVFFPIAEFLSSLTMGVIIWVGGISIVSSETASVGELMAFIMFIPLLFRPLNQIANKFNTLQMGMVAADRVFKVLDTQSQINDNGKLETEHFNGDISLEDVHFSYVSNEEVLKGINLEINSGETVAIVGATGAGKSTIVNLLNRFYDIDSGAIKIDGTNIQQFSLRALRGQIAVVLQDVFLFADTILNNITLNNPNITEVEVIKAAKAIGIHDFISSLPNGYHYNVKERGVMLSSGQRQLISFLRAYVTNPSILILDEATSSVDNYAEQLIQDATNKITEGRTSIIIAHRLATIQKADKIVVMDAGKIVEIGTHQSLLKRENGYYRNLYEVQFLKAEAV